MPLLLLLLLPLLLLLLLLLLLVLKVVPVGVMLPHGPWWHAVVVDNGGRGGRLFHQGLIGVGLCAAHL